MNIDSMGQQARFQLTNAVTAYNIAVTVLHHVKSATSTSKEP
jgi:hypothetical protein